jgi:BMFP domain-containing protein YqiC
MTNGQGRMFDDLAKLMNDAAGMAQSARREVESVLRAQADRVVSEMDLVRREDFDIAQDLARRALTEVEKLARRVEELEARMGPANPAPAPVAPGTENATGDGV